ncbi:MULTISPECIES: Zn-ribbon domain-containing OB-fold protein [Ochrobactrum]|uniref:ChsH2 C-terminal OB-fold domain-containing protein n=1 Tax=Ochrobactrum quorumnocens TaxID=271865 RepID=A0A5N1JW96_9HYPH|nr:MULTISPECIES: OB-fold domain-containing protein [Brucella/Ochrobactrum group]KAA9368286.1 hypothetical protein F3W84_10370 [[Ochrobactrum] quorumnocens]MBD7991814.1 OB-fold domain-containing protein [Ochrobactrum gallinarum]MDH7792484.1 putative OB-fold protein [Ochrobactrum sp. AN78]
MTPVYDYPVPAADDDNAAFLTAWRDRAEILLQVAAVGGKPFFYPRPICPYTGSASLVSITASGQGRILSYALVRRPNHPAFNAEVPIILAEVELEEGATMLARILCADPDKVQTGRAVETLPRAEAARYPLPTFRLKDPDNV